MKYVNQLIVVIALLAQLVMIALRYDFLPPPMFSFFEWDAINILTVLGLVYVALRADVWERRYRRNLVLKAADRLRAPVSLFNGYLELLEEGQPINVELLRRAAQRMENEVASLIKDLR